MPVTDPKVVKLYDSFAKRYFEYSFPHLLQYQLTQFTGFLEGKSVLDVGCGSGKDVEYLTDLGFQVVGIDASEKLLSEASQNVKAEFKLMAVEDLDFPEKSFDGIWSHAVLLYLDKETAKSVILKMRNILKEKGVVYLGLLEGDGEKEFKDKALDLNTVKIQLYSQAEIEEILMSAGFEILTSYSEDDDDGNPWLNVFARVV